MSNNPDPWRFQKTQSQEAAGNQLEFSRNSDSYGKSRGGMVPRVPVESHALLEVYPQQFAVHAGNGYVVDTEYSFGGEAARLPGQVIVRCFYTDCVKHVAGMVNQFALPKSAKL